ncbi:MAG: redoxin domain-containing protein [Deltaproteobacteria bacterium]|nr:redoxin domain-containing protein [Deltaproteobacteria bacterium]
MKNVVPPRLIEWLASTLLCSVIVLTLAGVTGAGELASRVPAPDFRGKVWFNSPPLRLVELRGKAVLVDFWEYTCINCIRTFPYLRRWNELYTPDGLVIIGVHTPEFAFANNPANVANALKRFGFTFPVVLDNDDNIWNAFHNAAWPADFLIDKEGRIAYMHIGEGDYGDTELAIRKLLKEAKPSLDFSSPRYAIPADANADMNALVCRRPTPETYLGFARAANLSNPGGEDETQEVRYIAPSAVPLDDFALAGNWKAGDEFVRHVRASSQPEDAVELHYQAKSVYLVAGSDDNSRKLVFVTQDGKSLPPNSRGVDVHADTSGHSYIALDRKRMYYLVNNPDFGDHTLVLSTLEPGVSLYSFTFGNNCENKFAHK